MKIVYFDVENYEEKFLIENNEYKYEYFLESKPLNDISPINEIYKNADIISVFTTSRLNKTVLEQFKNLKLIASIQNTINDDRIKEVLKLVGLDNEDKKKFKNYSLGMKQKLGIAQVIMEDADFLIFDEPFNGLDNKSCDDMRKLFKQLKKQGKIIIIATHVKEDIDNLIDVLYRIDNGSLIHEK